MKKNIISFLTVLCATTALRADLVDWGITGGYIYTDNSFSTIVSDGFVTRFGTFGNGYNFTGKTYSELNNDFIQWGTGSTTSGQFYTANTYTPNIYGTPWYIFLGNSASAFGVFTNPLWYDTLDPFVQPIDLGQDGTYAAGGFGYVGTGAYVESVALIPEPTTWALLAGSLTTLVIFRKRRKVS